MSVRRHRRSWATPVRTGALLALLVLIVAVPALANGGVARVVRQPIGPWFVTVYSSPTPLRTGEVDISVLVQDSSDSVLDVPVEVEAVALDTAMAPIRLSATRAQATNKLFKAAKFDVEAPGRWRFEVTAASAGTVGFDAEVARSTVLDRPLLLATLVLLPILVVGWVLRRNAAGGGASAATAASSAPGGPGREGRSVPDGGDDVARGEGDAH